VYIKHLNFI